MNNTIPRGFVILKDHIFDGGRKGFRISFTNEALSEDVYAQLPLRFKAYDDDDVLYYEGRCSNMDDTNDWDVVTAYEILQRDSGITRMEISGDEGRTWEDCF